MRARPHSHEILSARSFSHWESLDSKIEVNDSGLNPHAQNVKTFRLALEQIRVGPRHGKMKVQEVYRTRHLEKPFTGKDRAA